jgi:hypothetical protein
MERIAQPHGLPGAPKPTRHSAEASFTATTASLSSVAYGAPLSSDTLDSTDAAAAARGERADRIARRGRAASGRADAWREAGAMCPASIVGGGKKGREESLGGASGGFSPAKPRDPNQRDPNQRDANDATLRTIHYVAYDSHS